MLLFVVSRSGLLYLYAHMSQHLLYIVSLPLFVYWWGWTRRTYSISTYSTMMLSSQFTESNKADLTYFLLFILVLIYYTNAWHIQINHFFIASRNQQRLCHFKRSFNWPKQWFCPWIFNLYSTAPMIIVHWVYYLLKLYNYEEDIRQ